jgi:hypothetical protein
VETWTPIATTVLGYLVQWLFGIKKIPAALVYMLIGCASVLLYLMGCDCKPTWDRAFFVSAGGWCLLLFQAVRGMAGMSKDAKTAPKTDSL